MMDVENAADYLERAAMHDQLATATSDLPARKMHQAMAAEYRRKACQAGARMIVTPPPIRYGGLGQSNVA